MNATKLWRRIWNSIAPATITGINDTGGVLFAQVKIGALEMRDNVPVLQQFGLASTPPLGSDVALFYIGGDRSNGFGVGTNHAGTRMGNKAAGETALYNAAGMSIYLSATGIIINPNGVPLVINGDLHVTGEVIRGFGGTDQVTLGQHEHASGPAPTPGT